MAEPQNSKSELHQIVLNLLQEKRELLLRLQEERRLNSEHKEEIERLKDELREKDSVCSTGSEGQSTLCESSLSSKQHSLQNIQEQETVHRLQLEKAALRDKLCTVEENLREFRAKYSSLENQKFIMQREVMRLAQALSKATSTAELELTREQLRIYEQDYKKEKSEKDIAEKRASNLNVKIHDYEDLVSTLTTQVELYKRAFEREKQEKEDLVQRKVSTHDSSVFNSYRFPENVSTTSDMNSSKSPILPRSQLQLVHPLSESKQELEDVKRKQELERMGILTRDSKPSTSSGFIYGGDVETDPYTNF